MIVVLLLIAGACLGAFINFAIYAWAYEDRRISPWQKIQQSEPAPQLQLSWERLPILGWFARKRHPQLIESYGKKFWIRPLFIELVMMIGLPWFYYWQLGGGLTNGLAPPLAWARHWFLIHSVLLSLMTIATFIDLDERTIPDQITVTGTLFALVYAAFHPQFHMPEVVSNLAGATIETIHYAKPQQLVPQGEIPDGGALPDLFRIPELHVGTTSLVIALLVFAVWIFSLWPKLPALWVGVGKSMRFLWAYPMHTRKNPSSYHVQMKRFSFFLIALLVLGFVLLPAAYSLLPSKQWLSLINSILGLGIGGGLTWAVRIIGTYAMRQEALGFGDVTLMAMIGAFMGWQSTLLVFGLGALVGCVFGLGILLSQGQNMFAFGPSLCMGAAILLFSWLPIWEYASHRFFIMGTLVHITLTVSLVLMFVMLLGMQKLKGH